MRCSMATPYDILVNIDSGNGLLPIDTGPFLEPMLNYLQLDLREQT